MFFFPYLLFYKLFFTPFLYQSWSFSFLSTCQKKSQCFYIYSILFYLFSSQIINDWKILLFISYINLIFKLYANILYIFLAYFNPVSLSVLTALCAGFVFLCITTQQTPNKIRASHFLFYLTWLLIWCNNIAGQPLPTLSHSSRATPRAATTLSQPSAAKAAVYLQLAFGVSFNFMLTLMRTRSHSWQRPLLTLPHCPLSPLCTRSRWLCAVVNGFGFSSGLVFLGWLWPQPAWG